MKTVYGITTGCFYEGGRTNGTVYEDKSDADKEAMEIALNLNSQGDDYQYENDIWTYGSDYIIVREFEIK